ncbi:phage protein Gp27 family protein [Sphingomonas panni]|uniref:phage protein Gp27 family protein n=1 Tax=Sphingomonas panni TaxID=237612 RepID=UPI001F5B3E31|nr:phage protein Gp27 family protein [Sphingomonas panni]
MTDRRQGRGRLSSIDLLPDDAEPDIVWALEELRAGKTLQTDIVAEFNRRLVERGIDPVSKSAFGRWSLRKAVQFRRLDEVRAITADVVTGLGTDGADEVTVAIAEMLKVAIYENLEGGLGPKAVMELSQALKATVAAQKASADYRTKLEAQADAKAQKKVEEAMDRAGEQLREAGLSGNVVAQIRRDVLGVRSK